MPPSSRGSSIGSIGGGGGSHGKNRHKNRKKSGAAKRRRRRERANSLASADGTVSAAAGVGSSAGRADRGVVATTATSSSGKSSAAASSATATPSYMHGDDDYGQNNRAMERLSFSAEKQKQADITPIFYSTPGSKSSSTAKSSASGQDANASTSSSHVRSIEFVYPRSRSPSSSSSQPQPFVFSSDKKMRRRRKHKQRGDDADEEEEKKFDQVDSTATATTASRSRSATEESIDDILYPERKRERERLEAAKAAAAAEVRGEKEGEEIHDDDGSSSNKKKKRKRKRSIGDASDASVESRDDKVVISKKKEEQQPIPKKKRSNSIGSVGSEASEVASEKKMRQQKMIPKKKRSDSIGSVGSVGSSARSRDEEVVSNKKKKHKERSDSIGSVSSVGSSAGEKRDRSASIGSETSERAATPISMTSHQAKKKPKRKQSEDMTEEADRGLHRRLSGISVEEAVRDKVGRRPRSNSTDGELNLPRRGLCDERAVLESHKWDARRMYGANGINIKSVLRLDPRGFNNLGNTCYLNATLQCLAYLPTFCQCVAELPKLDSDSRVKGKIITDVIRALLRRAHNLDSNNGQQLRTGRIVPDRIVKSLNMLSSSSRGYKFRPGRQEDAHEFLVHLLDAMNDGELKAAGINQRKSGWRDRMPIPRLDETTFIHRIFGGYLRSQVRCTKCNYKSNTYDPFLDLALEVNKKDSVEKAFRDFTREETLDADNQWKCSGCKRSVCAKKQLTVFRPPLSLVIQLKRFTFGSGGGGMFGGLLHYGKGSGWGYGHYAGKGMGMNGRGGSKITKAVAFPPVLKLPLSDKRMCVYELCGVVIHVGGSATSGHYTAYIKKTQVGGAPPKWYHMDDSFVKQVSETTVLKQKHAYVLFYCRKEVDMPLPSPPPRKASMSASEAQRSGVKRAHARADSLTSLGSSQGAAVLDSPTPDKRSSKQPSEFTSSKSKSSSMPSASSSSSSSSSASSSSSESSSSSSSSDNDKDKGDISGARRTLDASLAKTVGGRKGSLPKAANKADPLSFPSDESSSSDSSSDDNSSASSEERKIPARRPAVASAKTKKPKTVSSNTGGGKVEVKIGNRPKLKAWKPATSSPSERRNDGSSDLLGNLNVGRWDEDEEDDDYDTAVHSRSNADNLSEKRRKKAIKEMESRDKAKKRNMHVNRWDATLDEGRTKKVKSKEPDAFVDYSPELNPFARIQSDMMKMNKGKAKGFHGTPPPKMPHKKRRQYGNSRRRSY